MFNQRRAVTEIFPAFGALIGFFARMDPPMSRQRRILIEAIAAFGALIGFFARMDPSVG